MGADWTEVTVEAIAASTPYALATGPFGSSIGSQFFTDAGVPLIRGSNLSDRIELRLSHDDLVFVAEETASQFERSVVRQGDLVFTCWGTVGQVGLIDSRCPYPRYLISNKQMKLTPHPDRADSLFLYYLFSGPELSQRIKNEAIGSSVPGFNLGQLRNLRVRLPPLGEQKAIAHILGTLDDKIDLNRRMNQTLEEVAQTFFRSWFVDFDPIRAKAAGRQPEGMDAETAALFPGRFVETELGNIPEGWPIKRLGDILELKRGYDLPSSQRVSGAVPVVSSSGPSGWHNEPKVSGPGIVTGRYGSIGEVFLVREDFWPLNTTLYVRDLKGSNLMYAYHLLRLLDFNKFSDKAAVPGINRNHLHEEQLVAAPQTLQERFSDFAVPLLELAAKNAAQMSTLAALRNTLLPKLLSGELRVGEAHAQVAASA